MRYAALAMLVCTAISGALILGAWLTRSEVRRARVRHGRHRRLPPALVFGHVTLALVTAAAWTTFVFVGNHDIATSAVALLAVTATLGATMFIRWIPTYRSRSAALDGPGAAHRATRATNLPIRVVLAHGAFAIATATLTTFVLLTNR
ncbi:hypothetical protein VMT65_23525 [Nocardia sp. CDC153]|uniref:hypothetical protein n=1 Tax=Nocardia sp. CDC153 TaxID=3112167 RepID=UPI002DB79344|nr:hypothetical protein [Nocardia sp. CDC153]MEC3956026.1 hypothetical protein [Nocardia sp. CDC153]